MSLLSSLLVLVVAARLLGRLFARYKQPEMIGEILAGIVLGPALLNLIAPNAALSGVTELAIFLIILNAGLEIRFADILYAMRGRGLVLAALSFLIPFIGGAAVAAAYHQDVMRMIFLGLCISITALPVAVKLLEGLGILHTKVAKYALATAVVNDVAALFILGIVLNIPQNLNLSDAAGAVGLATLKLSALALVVLSMNWLLTWLEKRDISIHTVPETLIRVFGPEALFGIVIVFVLVFGTI
ncbi:MAG TPA: cation:proton antiporter, partial [Denitromonas sp.]|nr:cation:proton antiporter [Denitromonas sp.]